VILSNGLLGFSGFGLLGFGSIGLLGSSFGLSGSLGSLKSPISPFYFLYTFILVPSGLVI
jgi:hypothetical protein